MVNPLEQTEGCRSEASSSGLSSSATPSPARDTGTSVRRFTAGATLVDPSLVGQIREPARRLTRMAELGVRGCTSTMRAIDVLKIKEKYELSVGNLEIILPATPHVYADCPPAGCCTVYESQLEAGLTFPLDPPILALLDHYDISVSQLAPNGIRAVMGFFVACRIANVRFTVSLFRAFFRIMKLQDQNWYSFQKRDHRRDPTSKGKSSWSNWKPKYFFLRHGGNEEIGVWRDRGKRGDTLVKTRTIHADERTLENSLVVIDTERLEYLYPLANLAMAGPDPYEPLPEAERTRCILLVCIYLFISVYLFLISDQFFSFAVSRFALTAKLNRAVYSSDTVVPPNVLGALDAALQSPPPTSEPVVTAAAGGPNSPIINVEEVGGDDELTLAEKSRKRKSSEPNVLAEMMRAQNREEKKKKAAARQAAEASDAGGSDHSDDLASMTGEALATRLRNATRAAYEVSREMSRRVKKPVEGLDALKKKIFQLEGQLNVVKGQFEFQQQVASEKTNEVDKLQASEKALLSERDQLRKRVESLEEASTNHDVEVGNLHVKVENLTASLALVPSQIEAARAGAVKDFLADPSTEKNLSVLMNTAISGGYTMAVQEIRALGPAIDVDVLKLENGGLFDLAAEARYDTYLGEFQQGVGLFNKYIEGVGASTNTSNPTIETSASAPHDSTAA